MTTEGFTETLGTYQHSTQPSPESRSHTLKKGSSGNNWHIFLWYDNDRIENNAANSFSIVALVFVAAVTSLPSPCLPTIVGFTYRHRLMGRIYEVAVQMGSGAMICIPSYKRLVRAFKSWWRWIHRQHGDCIRLLLFLQNKESRLKRDKLYDTEEQIQIMASDIDDVTRIGRGGEHRQIVTSFTTFGKKYRTLLSTTNLAG
jgi:hypothetical protein